MQQSRLHCVMQEAHIVCQCGGKRRAGTCRASRASRASPVSFPPPPGHRDGPLPCQQPAAQLLLEGRSLKGGRVEVGVGPRMGSQRWGGLLGGVAPSGKTPLVLAKGLPRRFCRLPPAGPLCSCCSGTSPCGCCTQVRVSHCVVLCNVVCVFIHFLPPARACEIPFSCFSFSLDTCLEREILVLEPLACVHSFLPS